MSTLQYSNGVPLIPIGMPISEVGAFVLLCYMLLFIVIAFYIMCFVTVIVYDLLYFIFCCITTVVNDIMK